MESINCQGITVIFKYVHTLENSSCVEKSRQRLLDLLMAAVPALYSTVPSHESCWYTEHHHESRAFFELQLQSVTNPKQGLMVSLPWDSSAATSLLAKSPHFAAHASVRYIESLCDRVLEAAKTNDAEWLLDPEQAVTAIFDLKE